MIPISVVSLIKGISASPAIRAVTRQPQPRDGPWNSSVIPKPWTVGWVKPSAPGNKPPAEVGTLSCGSWPALKQILLLSFMGQCILWADCGIQGVIPWTKSRLPPAPAPAGNINQAVFIYPKTPSELDFDDPHSTFCTDLQMLFDDRLWKSTFYCPPPFPALGLQCQPAHDINSWALPWLGSESNLVNSPPLQILLETDAFKSGWGAYRNLVKYKVLVGNGWSICNQEKTKADLLLGEPWR